ncbi:MAG TPA: hypothetical protein VD968_08635, partial [Pyrinomonadaceae bacterium]|nr:hypothetical protein [Pyrinomonadaceae bacterium]
VGPAPGGLVLAPDGSLDLERSFVRVNYFSLLGDASVRNNVQRGVENRPVDFVAVRLPAESLGGAARGGEDLRADEAVWLYGGRDRQALILAREDATGRTRIKYLPVANLRQDGRGRVTFDRPQWAAGFPLKIWEDSRLELPAGASREEWLAGWHTDEEWLLATHRTAYSNAVVGLHEQMARHRTEATDPGAPGLGDDERLIRRFRRRQRELVENDLLILANDHWNFDVRGFNPGGNHGSFFRASTHSVLMFAGGEATGIPRGLSVERPYDSLCLVPTLLALTGQIEDGARPVPVLWRRGFRDFPGRPVRELFDAPREMQPPVAGSAAKESAP